MAVVEDGDRREIFGMIDGAGRLVRLHHRHGLRAEGATQPLELAEMRCGMSATVSSRISVLIASG